MYFDVHVQIGLRTITPEFYTVTGETEHVFCMTNNICNHKYNCRIFLFRFKKAILIVSMYDEKNKKTNIQRINCVCDLNILARVFIRRQICQNNY